VQTLTSSRSARTATLCALYCAQGMPWGFVTITLLAYLAESGLELKDSANIMALATLPWSFKVVWGLVIDRFTYRPMGRRRPWVLGAQLGIGVTLLCMILQGDIAHDFELLAWMVFVNNCFVSLQDVATDALAVDILEPDERGRVNGLMWASNNLGTAIGGAGMGTVLAIYGVQAAFILQVSVLFGIALFPLLIRERAGERLLPWSAGEANRAPGETTTESIGDLASNLYGAFRSRAPAVGILFAAANSLMVGMMVTINPSFCTQAIGWTQKEYSQMEGGGGALAAVAGALVGGFLVDRLGVRRIILWAAVLIAGICLGLGLSDELRSSDTYVVFYLLTVNFLISAQTVAGFSLFMRLCSVAVAGTQFTLYMAAANFARVGGARVVAGLSSEQPGGEDYATLFLAMAGAILLALPFLFAIPREQISVTDSRTDE
jgi:PAT family beta-lactamase induction signal transducer AmpG